MPQTITPAVKERIQDMLREKIREISGQLTDRIGKLTQTGRVTQRYASFVLLSQLEKIPWNLNAKGELVGHEGLDKLLRSLEELMEYRGIDLSPAQEAEANALADSMVKVPTPG